MTKIKNVIFGFAGTSISDSERSFFRAFQPLGFIIFKRNVESPEQLTRLVAELKGLVDHALPLILIDQEGGRVRRLKPEQGFRDAHAIGKFALLAQQDIEKAKHAVFINHYLMGKELLKLGINVDCAPVLDLLHPGAHDIVGDRSFGSDPEIVSLLGKYAVDGLMAAGVLPIIKHIPGHGRATADSHFSLPRIDASLAELEATDFVPFRSLASAPFAMTAHLVIDAIDAQAPITLSSAGVRYIREELGFRNLIFTDDLSMQALSGSMAERAERALAAGCDLLLHCNGKPEEMQQVASVAQPLTDESYAQIENWANKCQTLLEFDQNMSEYLAMEEQDLEVKLAELIDMKAASSCAYA